MSEAISSGELAAIDAYGRAAKYPTIGQRHLHHNALRRDMPESRGWTWS